MDLLEAPRLGKELRVVSKGSYVPISENPHSPLLLSSDV